MIDGKALTDFFLDDAIENAKELDRTLEKTGKVVGPLHGVPVSIKVCEAPPIPCFSCGARLSETGSHQHQRPMGFQWI